MFGERERRRNEQKEQTEKKVTEVGPSDRQREMFP